MIDLHLHTIASDGMHAPGVLVALARTAGITTLGVADHDTMASVPELEQLTREAGLGFVPGIEITAVENGRDVHLLGYFLDWRSPRLSEFLLFQRADRERRARLIGERLATLGAPVDIEGVITAARPAAVSRPLIARALVAAGRTSDVSAAFDLYLGDDRPAWVPRIGATPAEVVALVNAEGGAVSMAHPGLTNIDGRIPALARAGLAALEVFHPDHAGDDVARYQATAAALGLAVTGGSDYHGDGTHHVELGAVSLPSDDFAAFLRRAGRDASQGPPWIQSYR